MSTPPLAPGEAGLRVLGLQREPAGQLWLADAQGVRPFAAPASMLEGLQPGDWIACRSAPPQAPAPPEDSPTPALPEAAQPALRPAPAGEAAGHKLSPAGESSGAAAPSSLPAPQGPHPPAEPAPAGESRGTAAPSSPPAPQGPHPPAEPAPAGEGRGAAAPSSLPAPQGPHPPAEPAPAGEDSGQLLAVRLLSRPQHWPGRGDGVRWHAPLAETPQAPSRGAALQLRARLLRSLREALHSADFLEVETPALAQAPSPEAVFTPLAAQGGWLVTSPEHHLKRLLVGGFARVYRLGPVWRGGELGAQHNPEFTLLEWCEAFAAQEQLCARLQALLARCAPLALEAASLWGAAQPVVRTLQRRAAALGGEAPWPRWSVAEALARTLGLQPQWSAGAAGLRRQAIAAGLPQAATLPADDFTATFSLLWDAASRRLPPGPLLICDWPAQQASLARLHPADPQLALRVELYVDGLELANGFCELTDAAEQRRRYAAELARRGQLGLPLPPLDEAFLQALEQGLPPAAGMALGVDRLAMLLMGAPAIKGVLAFAWDER